jgi:hypothetical protein
LFNIISGVLAGTADSARANVKNPTEPGGLAKVFWFFFAKKNKLFLKLQS